MRFEKTPLSGLMVVEIEPVADSRGLFGRTFCEREFAAQGICSHFVQFSTSYNIKRGTLRGMHLQIDPHAEDKLVRCTQGAIYDVALDLRPDSPTFRKWFAIELTAENRKALFIPKGFAHGFQTLVDSSEVLYLISAEYAPQSARGVRWNDPQFAITWPLPAEAMSDKDAAYADFTTR